MPHDIHIYFFFIYKSVYNILYTVSIYPSESKCCRKGAPHTTPHHLGSSEISKYRACPTIYTLTVSGLDLLFIFNFHYRISMNFCDLK